MARPVYERWVAPAPDVGTPGGRCAAYTAAVALLIGDAVWLSASQTVSKSAVTADHLKRIGIVVGGKALFNDVSTDALDVGDPAAAINDMVFVATEGICYAIADNTAILVGSPVAPSTTTAGRVRLATVTTDLVAGDTGKILGIALDANGGVAGTKIRVQLGRM